jgi:hypothetical protein
MSKKKAKRRTRKDGQPDGRTGKKQPQRKPGERAKFADWLATPPKLRNPKTQKALAKQLGVHEWTLSVWKKDPQVLEAVRGLNDTLVELQLPRVMEALVQICEDKSQPSMALAGVKVFLQAVGRFQEGPTLVQTGGVGMSVANLTPEQRAELQATLMEKMGVTPMDPSFSGFEH